MLLIQNGRVLDPYTQMDALCDVLIGDDGVIARVAEHIDATVANMRWVKPLDVGLVRELAASHDVLVTLEEGCIAGGAGAAVSEALSAAGLTLPVLHLGLPDQFIEHGDPAKLLALQGLDAAGIERSIRERFLA